MKSRMEFKMSSPMVIGVDIGKEVFHLVGVRFRRSGPPRRGSVTAAARGLDGQARCTIRVDKIGNIFARQPDRDTSLPPAMTGDTSTRSRP